MNIKLRDARSLFADTEAHIVCPRCSSTRGIRCSNPAEHDAPHVERVALFVVRPGFRITDYETLVVDRDEYMHRLAMTINSMKAPV